MALLLNVQPLTGLVQPSRRRCVVSRATTATERLMGATRLTILDHADSELANLCSSKATAEEQAKCWEVGAFADDVGPRHSQTVLCLLPRPLSPPC